MDTNVIIAIVAVVVIAALLAIGGWWFGKSRKSAVDKSTEAAKAKADARLATEKSAAQSAAASAENAEKTKETAESAATEVESATSSATPESPVATEPTPVGSAVTESATPAVETPEAAGTRMQRLKARLSKSGNPFGRALFNILAKDQLSESDWEDVEDTLLLADVGAEASEQLVEELRNDARIAGQSDPAEVRAALKDKESKPNSITRSLPIMSLDSGLFFERETNLFGGDYVQTLEPRLFYLRVQDKDQTQIPVFDSNRFDVGFAQIFSENRFSGSDRVGDANDLTAAVTTRFIDSDTGVERLRALLGQRYYFSDQQVYLFDQSELRRAGRGNEILAGLGGQINKRVSVDSYMQFNTETNSTERLNANIRYQAGFARTLNLSYRYAPKLPVDRGVVGLEDIDVSGQWPIARNWYGVGRVTHSLKDNRVTEAVAGLEYDGGCWVFRTAMHRFAIDENDVTNAIFVQLELNDLAGIGSNPLSLIKRSVPGYGKINDSSADRVFGAE